MKQHEAEQKRMKAEALKIFQEKLIPRSRQKSSKNQFAGLENAVIQWGWLDTSAARASVFIALSQYISDIIKLIATRKHG